MLIPTDNAPICPGKYLPQNQAHTLHAKITDEVYEAFPKNAEGEIEEHVEAIYSTAIYGPDWKRGRMRLYVERIAAQLDGRYVTVESCFWHCGICGTVLPATAKP